MSASGDEKSSGNQPYNNVATLRILNCYLKMVKMVKFCVIQLFYHNLKKKKKKKQTGQINEMKKPQQ